MKTITLTIKHIGTLISMALISGTTLAQQPANVFDIIESSPNHTYLEQAIIQEGLQTNLEDANATLTVFAPTDQAFTDLATALGTDINGILALPNLSDVLLYHVLGAEVMAADVTNGLIASPLFTGQTLKMTKTSTDDVYANQAQVTAADLASDNGVVHVLSSVVLPVETVVDVAIDNNFNYLTTAVVQEELLPALTNPLAEYTVFAPTDQAFTDLATALGTDINGILALPNLTEVLLYHVLGAEVMAADVTNGLIASPLYTGQTLKMTKTSTGDVYANQAQVSLADVTASNGVVHVLDGVVLPVETVVDVAIDNNFTALTTAVVQEELLPALTNPLAELTVFAPTDQAFSDLATALGTDINGILALPNLTEVLLYHVLGAEVLAADVTNGLIATPLYSAQTIKMTKTTSGEVYANQAQVSTADVTAFNGAVHILDAVILPVETVVDIAIDNNFSALTTAVVQEELLPALTNPFAQYTVFAPTDQAFTDLATELGTDVNGILALPNLTDILLYHVVGSAVASTDLTNGEVEMLDGNNVTIDLTNGVMVNDAMVTTADLPASNGIVHVIDKVLLFDATSSLDENEMNNISIYPNPSEGILNIKSSENINTSYAVFDYSGKEIMNGEILSFLSQINLSNVSQGEYIIKFENNPRTFKVSIK